MSSENEGTKARWPLSALVAVGALGGALFGVIGLTMYQAHLDGVAMVTAVKTGEPTRAPTPEYWYIWSGSAPLNGESFSSKAECDAMRRDVLAIARKDARESIEQLPPISYRQVRTLGYNPADRILEVLDKFERAYCRTG